MLHDWWYNVCSMFVKRGIQLACCILQHTSEVAYPVHWICEQCLSSAHARPPGSMLSCRPFQELPSPCVQIFLTEGRGWGVKAAHTILCSSFIVEFVGEPASPVQNLAF